MAKSFWTCINRFEIEKAFASKLVKEKKNGIVSDKRAISNRYFE